MREVKWERVASICVALVGGGFLLYLLARFLLALFLPFLLAFLLAIAVRPLARFLAGKTGWSSRVCAVLATLLILLLLGLLIYLLALRLFTELERLIDFLVEDSAKEDGSVARMLRLLREWGTRVPFLSRLQELDLVRELIGDPSVYFTEQLQKMLGELAGKLTGALTALLGRLPGVLLFLMVTLIACVYFALEYEKVCQVLERLLPPGARAKLPEWKNRFTRAFKRCVKAYLVLFLLTLVELFAGFLLLRTSYPFLLALLGASLDILPVLGVGIMLIPWGLFALVTGQTGRGVGLLILYAVMSVIRQIAEPHLVGKSIGLHPILMLIAFYVGISLFGVSGILIGPMLALLAKLLFDRACGTEKV